jgi:hypothetical protein
MAGLGLRGILFPVNRPWNHRIQRNTSTPLCERDDAGSLPIQVSS